MIKEKIIFWPLLAIFLSIVIFGFFSQGRKKEATEELLQDIELATKKVKAQKKDFFKDSWNLESVMALDTIDGYRLLLQRSPFFRLRPEVEHKEVELIPLKEEPKEPLFKYKGKVMMGKKVMVVIEDQGTGKSFFVKKGEMIGDFVVLRIIDDKEVALKKKGGEEVVLKMIKEAKVDEKDDEKDDEVRKD